MSLSRPYPLSSQTELAPVRVIATANQAGTYFNGTLNNGVGATLTYTSSAALTIDSVALATNDFILLAGQTLAYQNGIYIVTNPGSAATPAILTRRTDFQTREQMQAGAFVPVSAGTTNQGVIKVLVEPLPAAIGAPSVSGANDIVFKP